MLLEQGPLLLKHRGLLALEIDHTHAAFVRAACPAAVIETDVHGRVRYAFLTRAPQR